MSLRVQTNTEALNAYRNLSMNQDNFAKSMEKLSSGYRINRSADDASGLSISEEFRGQIGGLKSANANIQDAINLVQTAEGYLNEVHSMLQRQNELAVRYNNDSLSDDAKEALSDEFTALANEIGRIRDNARFNETNLFFDGSKTNYTFQIEQGVSTGTRLNGNTTTPATVTDSFDVIMPDLNNAITAGTSITAATTYQNVLDDIANISDARSLLGAQQNRLERMLASNEVALENFTAYESRIRDTDMAAEMVKFTKANILQQAGTAMLAQANGASQGVLQLLR